MTDPKRHINSNTTARAMPPKKGGDQSSLDSMGSGPLMLSPVGMELRDHLISWVRVTQCNLKCEEVSNMSLSPICLICCGRLLLLKHMC